MLLRLRLLPFVLLACSGASSNDAAPTRKPIQPGRPSLFVVGGKHFAEVRVYEGNCAPPGSRGGCVTITLRPDGTYRNFQYDMAIDGTYTIADGKVTLTGPEPGMVEEMTLSPDGKKLDELTLK